MITLRINKTTKLQAPECWEETTTAQFQEIVKVKDPKTDYLKIFSILTGHEFTGANEVSEATIWKVIQFIFMQPFRWTDSTLPKILMMNGKPYSMPKGLSELSVAQNIHVRQELDTAEDIREKISIATAIYLQPYIDGGQFDLTRAHELEKEIRELPITDTYPIGFFLLKRINESGRNFGNGSSRTRISLDWIRLWLSQKWHELNYWLGMGISTLSGNSLKGSVLTLTKFTMIQVSGLLLTLL